MISLREPAVPIPPEYVAELQVVIDRLVRGIRDPETMDRMRERVGEVEVAVDLIREAREES
jgi:hypothetical protein